MVRLVLQVLMGLTELMELRVLMDQMDLQAHLVLME